MVCSARPARCGPFVGGLVGSGGPAASDVLAALLIGSAVGATGVLTGLAIAGVPMAIAGTAAAAAGALAGLIAAPIAYFVMMTIIIVTYLDRCDEPDGLLGCAMGQVSNITAHLSHSATEALFPFTMMHDRIDLVTQSRHWGAIERNEAFVFCTSDTGERTSEILRCYFFNSAICAAGLGAMIGGGVLGAGGIVVGALAAAAVGCATIFLCVLAVLLAVLIVVAAVLIGAAIGSNIGHALSEDSSRPSIPGAFITRGDILHIDGNMVQRGFDGDANVLWFTKEVGWHDRTWIRSHCELDELPPMCPADLI